jgi:signal transduction histidine kinase
MPFNHPSSTTQHFSPRRIITIGVLFALACTIISTTLAVNTRWLGVNFTAVDTGLRVTQVNRGGPASGQLYAGDIVTAISAPGLGRFDFQPMDIMEDPYDLQLYSEFEDFFQRQSAIYTRLQQDNVTFILTDGHEVTVTPGATRPPTSLPFLFWFQLASGYVGLLIGIGVFAFRQEEIATRCFAASAIGLMTIITAAAMYSSRELAIDGRLFYYLTLTNQYGTVFFAAFGTAVLWYSPRRISPFPMASLLFTLYAVFALLHTLAVWDTLNVGIRFPIIFFVVIIIIFAIFSWRSTRGRPASRAALKWLLFSWFSGIVLFFSLRLIPVALGTGSLIPQASAWLVLDFIYVGVALGITRYRLFNLDRWVLRAWFWIFSGLAMIAVDITLVSLLDINTPLATAISLAIVGWIYFPLRQVIWARYAPGMRRIDFENLFPEILEMTLSPGQDGQLFNKFRDMLQRVYEPLEIKILPEQETVEVNAVRIIRNGIGLQLPALPGGSALELSGAEHADRLFNPNDARFASAVWGLFNHAVQFRLALEQGAHVERQRIARDLHDDVAARLLTLVHRSDDAGYEKLARQALTALRDTIYTLGTQTPSPLEDLLLDMRHEIQQRLEAVDIQLAWNLTGDAENIALNPRQHINLQRILQELVSNVIHHAQASRLALDIEVQNSQLHISACDNGIGGNIDEWTLGKGLNNIKNRVHELHGSVTWQGKDHGCCVNLKLPV